MHRRLRAPESEDWEPEALSVIIELDESIAQTLDLAPEQARGTPPYSSLAARVVPLDET